MSDVTLFQNAGLPPAKMGSFKKSLKAATAALQNASSSVPFLRMQKDGTWAYGTDSIEVEEGSLWAIDPLSMEMGYIAWGEEKTPQAGTVLGRRMVLIADEDAEPIQRGMLPDVGAEWTPCVGFRLACVSGEDKGITVKYESNSVGGRNAFTDLLKAIEAIVDSGSDKIVPVVELGSGSYPHKKYGKIYTPVFEPKKWVMQTATSIDDSDAAAPARAAVTNEPQQEEKAAAPQQQETVRTRRRR